MFSSLRNALFGTTRPTYSSSVLILKIHHSSYVLHVVPETGFIERVDEYRPGVTALRMNGSRETSRELLDTVTLYVGDGENPDDFLKETGGQVVQILGDKRSSDHLHQALCFAALDGIRKRQGREPPRNAAQAYSVLLVEIARPQPDKIMAGYKPTSIMH